MSIDSTETEVECVEEWAKSIWLGRMLSITMGEYQKLFPANDVHGMIPIDATVDEHAAMLRDNRKWFGLPPEEPQIMKPIRIRLEKKARRLADADIKRNQMSARRDKK